MKLIKIFSEHTGEETRFYSVPRFQKEFSSESKKKDQKLTNKEKAGAALIGTGVSSGAYLLPKINKDRLKGTVTRYHNTAAENVDSILDKGILGKYTSNPDNMFPSQAFISRISKYTDKVYVTTLATEDGYTSFNGNIRINSKINESITVNCSNNNVILKDTDWFKKNRVWE